MPNSFDALSSKRIAKSVLWTERHYGNAHNPPYTYRPANEGFWAVIQDYRGVAASDGSTNAYSWIALQPHVGGVWLPNESWGHGEHNGSGPANIVAVCLDGSPHCIWGDKVWLSPAISQDFYVFEYHGGGRNVIYAGSGEATVLTTPTQTLSVNDFCGADITDDTEITIMYCAGSWEIIKVCCS